METITADITREERDRVAKVLGKSKVSDKTVLAMRMVSQGIPQEDILQLALGKDSKTCDHKTVKALKVNSHKWLLASDKMQKLASNRAEDILKGRPIIGKYKTQDGETKENIILPKASHVVALIDMVTKRTEPVNGNDSKGDTFNFVQISANQFRDKPQDVVQIDSDNNGSGKYLIESGS